MNIKKINIGNNVPHDINVVIEIPAYYKPVKYEFNKDINALEVDRFMSSSMHYPGNYGFIPNTLSEDGDPLDCLVITPCSIQAGVIINTRPIGILRMIDESGFDAKIISVANNTLTTIYNNIKEIDDLPEMLLNQIQHFFKHYKDLDSNKWVKIDKFEKSGLAKEYIISSIERYKTNI